MFHIINSRVNSTEITNELIGILYQEIFILTQEVWNERCVEVQDKEQLKGITTKAKNTASHSSNDFKRSGHIDHDYYSQRPDTIGSLSDILKEMTEVKQNWSNF